MSSCLFTSLRIPPAWLLFTISLILRFLAPFSCEACPVFLLLTPVLRLSLMPGVPAHITPSSLILLHISACCPWDSAALWGSCALPLTTCFSLWSRSPTHVLRTSQQAASCLQATSVIWELPPCGTTFISQRLLSLEKRLSGAVGTKAAE